MQTYVPFWPDGNDQTSAALLDSEDSEELEVSINRVECAYPPFEGTDDLVFDEADTYASEFNLQLACMQQMEHNTMLLTPLSEDGGVHNSSKGYAHQHAP